jgi:hypothetical protein
VPRDAGRRGQRVLSRLTGRDWRQVVEGAVVDQEVEAAQAVAERGEVVLEEVHPDAGRDRLRPPLRQRGRCEVDTGDGEAVLSQKDRVGTGPAAEVDRTARPQAPVADQADEFLSRPDLPWHPEEPVAEVVQRPGCHQTWAACGVARLIGW